jgi:hypothetical protein
MSSNILPKSSHLLCLGEEGDLNLPHSNQKETSVARKTEKEMAPLISNAFILSLIEDDENNIRGSLDTSYRNWRKEGHN